MKTLKQWLGWCWHDWSLKNYTFVKLSDMSKQVGVGDEWRCAKCHKIRKFKV